MQSTFKQNKILEVITAIVLILIITFCLLPVGSASAATTYTLTFEINGGSRTGGGELVQTVSHNQIYASITLPTVSKTGYTFGGWWLDAACTSIPLGSLQGNGITSSVTLYAKWVPNSLTVTYNPNGGNISSGNAAQSITAGTYYMSLSVPAVTRTGYTFAGWHTSGGIAIATMPQQAITSDITLYAYWTLDSSTTYTVTYNPNGGNISSGSSTQTVNSGALYMSLSTPSVSRSGYTFGGWWLDAACTSTPLGAIAGNGIASNVTLYAKWTYDGGGTTTYTVTYNPNSGNISSGNATQTVSYGTYYLSLTTPAVSRTGYTFAGWYTSGNVPLSSMSQQTITANITLYAHWTEAGSTFNVTYNPNGGIISSGNHTQSVASSTKYSGLSYPVVIRTDYKFAGWYLDAACLDNPVSEIQNTVIASSITLYAKWTATNIVVFFERNGGDIVSGNATQTVVYNQPYLTLAPPTVSRNSYDFGGWWLDAACTSTPLGSLSTHGITSNVTIYAKWNPKTLLVTYNLNGGTVMSGSEQQEISYGTPYVALSPPGVAREGYTFAGWYNENGEALGATPQREILEDMTFVVKWAELKFLDIGNNIDNEVKKLTFSYNIETGKYETKILLNDCGKTFSKIFNKTYNDNVNNNLNTTAALFNIYYDDCSTTPFVMFEDIKQRIGSIETNMELRYDVIDNGLTVKYNGIILAVTADKIADSYAKIIYAQSGSVLDPEEGNWFTQNKGAIIAVLVIIAVICVVLFILLRVPLFLWVGIIFVAVTILAGIII